MLSFYVWMTIELWFYAGIVLSGIGFLLVRTQIRGVSIEGPMKLFSAKSDHLEADSYRVELALSFAAPTVVTSWLIWLNNSLNNESV